MADPKPPGWLKARAAPRRWCAQGDRPHRGGPGVAVRRFAAGRQTGPQVGSAGAALDRRLAPGGQKRRYARPSCVSAAQAGSTKPPFSRLALKTANLEISATRAPRRGERAGSYAEGRCTYCGSPSKWHSKQATYPNESRIATDALVACALLPLRQQPLWRAPCVRQQSCFEPPSCLQAHRPSCLPLLPTL